MSMSYEEDVNTQSGLGCSRNDANGGSLSSWSVQAFLDQCMQYHEQQEQKRQLHEPYHSNESYWNNIIDNHAETRETLNNYSSEQIDSITSKTNDNHQQYIQEATRRAMEVLERLKHQPPDSSSLIHQTQSQPDLTPEEFRQRRQRGFEGEAERRRHATLRNFAYLTKQHERKLQILNQQIEHSRRIESQVYAAQQAALKQRQERLLQKTVMPQYSSTKDPSNSMPSTNNTPSRTDTVAFYISGLPTFTALSETDQTSAHSSTSNGDPFSRSITSTLTTLFAEYGSLKKIHLYRNRQTNQLKGDGLVIYNWKDKTGAERSAFVEKVCAERNGLQFPSGETLSVEPARSNDSSQQEQTNYYGRVDAQMPVADDSATVECAAEAAGSGTTDNCYGPASSTVNHAADKEASIRKDDNKVDDDLDEFFSSIE